MPSATILKGGITGFSNATIGNYFTPSIVAGTFIMFFMFFMFMMAFNQLTALQTPSFFPEKSPNRGKFEENE